jgi:hypothetical protein
MCFVKPSSTTPVIVKGREGDADVANKACLRCDLAKEWGDVSRSRAGCARGKFLLSWLPQARLRLGLPKLFNYRDLFKAPMPGARNPSSP